MTLTNFQKNLFTIAAATVVVGLIIFFWPKSCGRPIQPQPTVKVQETPEYKSLMDTLHARDKTVQALFEYGKSVVQEKNQKDSALKVAQAKLAAIGKKGSSLANEVINAKANKDSAAYIRSCDSLAYVNRQLGSRIETDRHACEGSIRNREQQLMNKDRIISTLEQQTKGYAAAIKLLQDTKAIESTPPWVIGYLGIEADFGGLHMVDGFGPKALFIFRNGTGLTGGVKFFDGRTVYEGGIYKQISFKRH